MRRFLVVSGLSCALLAGAANAQSAPSKPVETQGALQSGQGEPLLQVVSEDELKAEYAARIVAVSLPDLEKTVREAIGTQMASLPASFPAAQANWLRKTSVELTLVHIQELIKILERVYVENFTLEEMSAVIAFRETEIGRSISRKELAMGQEMGLAMVQMQQAMMADLRARYCQQFSCGANESAMPKNNRH